METMKKCFVIMPFSKTKGIRTAKYWEDFYLDFLKPAIETHGYDAFKSEAGTNNITKKIIQDLAWTDLVLAVLTDANPNVMWELGARHSLRGGTIMILEKRQKRPFDIQDHGVLGYQRDDITGFKTELGKYIKSAETRDKDSPIAEFLNQRITESVNLAIGRLRQCVEIINRSQKRDYADALQEIKSLQDGLNNELEQVSVIINGKFVVHAQNVTIGQRGEEQWIDQTTSPQTSLYPMMKDRRWGFRIVQLQNWEGRVTAMAFEQVKSSDPQCMVIAEAHYFQEGRPY